MKRTFAIIVEDSNLNEVVANNVKLLSDNKLVDQIYIVTDEADEKWNNTDNDVVCNNIVFPNDCNNMPKKRNWLNQFFRKQNYDGMLYVAEDIVKFENSPDQFFTKLENMMKVLDYPVWFNTISDGCNYVYKKYMPRVSLIIDKPEYAKFELGKILFTSHSNTSLIAYDFATVTDDQLTFNEQFDVPMYYIIEFLARRRNNKQTGSLFFMNQYMTIPEEHNAFTVVSSNKNAEITNEKMKKEDELFKSMNVNYASDNNIDQLLEMTYEKLKSKI